jgi:Flp pilus assembly protein TadG
MPIREKRMATSTTGPRDPERGAIAVLMAIALTVIMGFAAFGFDLAYVRLAREEMANATDAAAHAAGITLSITNSTDSATTEAINVAAKNTVLGSPMKLVASDLVFGSYDFGTKTFVTGAAPATAVKVTGQKTTYGDGLVKLTFGRVFGFTDANVTQAATAAYINRYFQVELQASDDWLCEIDNAADAAVDLLDYLNGPAGSQGDWIGLDEFTGRTQEITALMNVRTNYNTGPNNIHFKWQRDTTVLGIQSQSWTGPNPPPAPQTRGITVCSKANGAPNGFGTPNVLPPAPGGYRQCPGANPPVVPVKPAGEQFAFPNHAYLGLNCSDGGPAGLFAGTDLGAAINDGAAKLNAKGQSYEPHALILINDGTPMACTGIGGGGLCGHTYGGDGATPPSGKTSADYWSPCCANGLTCGANVTYNGYTFGGGDWGDGSPSNSPNGQAACDAAHQLVKNAMDAATNAANAGIDVFVIGFFRNSTTGVSQDFDTSLVRNHGTGVITTDSSQISTLLKRIPLHLPVSLVR